MINYIDERKLYVPFNKLEKDDQVDRIFFLWEKLFMKLRASV